MDLGVIEICAGAGGQALGLERSGFEHALAVELDPSACATLRANRPAWKVAEGISSLCGNGRGSPPAAGPAGYRGPTG